MYTFLALLCLWHSCCTKKLKGGRPPSTLTEVELFERLQGALTIHHSPCCLIGTSLEQFTLISQIHRLYHCYHCHWSLLSIVSTILYHRLWICVLSFLYHWNRKTHSRKRHFSSTHPGANWHSLRQRASDKFFGGCTGSPFSTLEQWTNPWLFREYRGLYYPFMWGLW